VTASCAERWFGTKDHRAIVIDEIVGMVLALLALPFRIGYVIAAFVLFRALDIFKPLPAIEHLPGGWGIMCDDLVAAIITNIVLQGVRVVLP
jgi:phosphatidylglycerophosphatase A